MFTADQVFATLVFIALPATLLYPIIYGLTSPWWRSWIGRALLVKAIGVAILLTFSALYQALGPDYPYRDTVRISGMVLACIGFYLALFALLQVKLNALKTRVPGETWRRHSEERGRG